MNRSSNTLSTFSSFKAGEASVAARLLFVISLSLSLLAGTALAADEKERDVLGVWKTAVNDKGSYIHVDIQECEGGKLCGTIVDAFRKGDVKVEDYEHKGKQMVWGMKVKGTGSWGSGGIWAPDSNKKYSAGLKTHGRALKVTGCVAGGLICRSQYWVRVPNS